MVLLYFIVWYSCWHSKLCSVWNVTEFGYGGTRYGFFVNSFYKYVSPLNFSFNYGIIPFNPILVAFPLWFKFYKKNRLFSYLIISIIGLWFLIMCSLIMVGVELGPKIFVHYSSSSSTSSRLFT